MNADIEVMVHDYQRNGNKIILDNDYHGGRTLHWRGEIDLRDVGFSLKLVGVGLPFGGGFMYGFEFVSGDFAQFSGRGLIPGDRLFVTPKPPKVVEAEMDLTKIFQLSSSPKGATTERRVNYGKLIREEAINAIFQMKGKIIPDDECEYQGDADFQILMYSFRKIITTIKKS